MADIAGNIRGLVNRGTRDPTAPTEPVEDVRATSRRAVPPKQGNAGKIIGYESIGGVRYARYQAEKGTWVSASLAEQRYDQKYGKDTAYGAYLGVALGPDGRPLKTPDKIEPGQQYLIPVGTTVNFDDTPVTGYKTPQTRVADPWQEAWYSRLAKDVAIDKDKLPYGSFELRGPEPPSRTPRNAVAFWLTLHRDEIVRAEARWRVTRIAIAGAIAWEALENPERLHVKTVGPGKIHITADEGRISWPDAVEYTGREKVRPEILRKVDLAKSDVAIDYIGAIFDFIAEVAETKNWNLRNSPDILGQVYHSKAPDEWIEIMKAKPAGGSFGIQPGAMGDWIQRNQKYLEAAVGKPEIQ